MSFEGSLLYERTQEYIIYFCLDFYNRNVILYQ